MLANFCAPVHEYEEILEVKLFGSPTQKYFDGWVYLG
jgi:hypothetical protein